MPLFPFPSRTLLYRSFHNNCADWSPDAVEAKLWPSDQRSETSSNFGGGAVSFHHETSSPFCARRCPDLRWSGQFGLRHPRKSGLGDAAREMVRSVSLDASPRLLGSEMQRASWSSQLRQRYQGSEMQRARWSSQFRQRHHDNSEFRDTARRFLASFA